MLTAFIFIICASFSQASVDSRADNTGDEADIKVYLPREITVGGNRPTLGQVSVIRGEESLVARANGISLGRLSVPGQEIVIDRATVLSRLASNGISASEVTLTGAEKMTIKRQQRIIKGDELVELARSFLEENLIEQSVCRMDQIGTPTDLAVPPSSKEIRLSPCLELSRAKDRADVQIAVLADGQEIGTRKISFRLKYNCHRAVALADIPSGAAIGPDNVRIEDAISSYPEPADWRPPHGLVAKRRIPANIVIRGDMVGQRGPAVIVKRNQNVIIQIESDALVVTAIGKTMQQAGVGEYIKVRNVDSQRIILARVSEDGTVEPVF
jgi:flagella basal body P-ring formation protein FlgA